ncbi:DUF3037 domain-containing protein [Actinospica durhamensis]|uniref:DUF3037 domain-containing protein n=1 Tax=Actinospica durhamensis TaxID=1508375 RepID=A0A941ERT1_9ACTN|nr:DUF3037 domain-containing protein [Actinospica durhamensis]MBR7832639.1 DUF3037 domain-containing protein [Actinospica durhamensis]
MSATTSAKAAVRLLGYDCVVLRAVPRPERGEQVNVGAVLYCQEADFLGAAVYLDPARLRALDPDVDLELLSAALDGIRDVCAGAPCAGEAGAANLRNRFGWLSAPRSTVLQPGPIHGGLTADPGAELERLMNRMVR